MLPPLKTAPDVVVFDFDLTLTRWDTADRFFRWLLRRQWWRGALVLFALPALAPMLALRRTRRLPTWYAVWVATLGCSTADLCELVEAHVEEIFAGGDPVFLNQGLERLRQHIDHGDRVVVATGCIEVLALALLRRAGFDDVVVVGSSLKRQRGGLVRHEHCFGAGKISMLAARGYAAPWAVTYTDHPCDLPVLELARERFLVNPAPGATARIEQALGCQCPVLAWR